MTATKPYVSLIDQIGGLLHEARKQIVSQVNQTMVMTYRTIGQYIVEYEQGGADRAEYGNKLIPTLSKDLSLKFGKGFGERNIENMRKFYLLYQNYGQGGSLSPIPQTLSAEFKLSRSHYIFLIKLEESERKFYEIESAANNRSLRELKRQFDSGLFLRLALSKDKEGVKTLSEKGQIITKPQDIVKDPYILEFLGLKEESKYSESDLEQAIIDKIENFLLELGKGFAFIRRQQRFTFNGKAFFCRFSILQ